MKKPFSWLVSWPFLYTGIAVYYFYWGGLTAKALAEYQFLNQFIIICYLGFLHNKYNRDQQNGLRN